MIIIFLSTIIFILLFFYLFKSWQQRWNKCTPRKLLPPSPPRLPLLGNLHQLGSLPHRSLAALAENYGPLMLVHLGCVPTIVVSSAELAREVMKTHDLSFASRPASSTAKKLMYDCDIGFAPYGEYWRQARRVCVLHLLTSKRVQSFRSVREEEASLMLDKIRASASASAPVNLSKTIRAQTNDIVSRVVFGRKYADANHTDMFAELTTLLGLFPAKDFVPGLAWLDRASGLDARLEKNYRELDGFLERMLEEHEHRHGDDDDGGDCAAGDGGRKECANFVDILLSHGDGQDGSVGMCLSRDNLKALILDMIVGATDTISTSLEWAMAELVKNPSVMKRAQKEVREVAGGGGKIAEEDLERTEYTKAVIKETLRLHPPIPLLIPRETTEKVMLRGYEIPAGTRVIVNAWAIGRDPKSWEEPEGFFPDRFLLDRDRYVDFRGHDFGLIPFGSGRRSCPGMELAAVTLQVTLAHLLRDFDWELLPGEVLDITETPGLTVHKKSDLILIPRNRDSA